VPVSEQTERDRRRSARRQADAAGLPPWTAHLMRMVSFRLVLVLIVAAIGTVAALGLIGKLTGFLSIIVTALFLSFAIEPGVNWFAARGWRRGSATGLIFLIVFLAIIGLMALVIPAIVTGFRQLITSAPHLVDTFVKFANKLGLHLTADKITEQVQANSKTLASSAAGLASNIFGITALFLGGLFHWATVALFTFYIVAEGPHLRRVICGKLPPQRQEEVLFIWEQAIEKTGGYFYSRLLLAVINGSGMYLTLRLLNVPFAAPLAIFEGVVAEFIPIVGTYIAGVAPLLVALLTSVGAGIGTIAYILIYQQLENYILSPRLTAKTMNLHPAVAFAAALIGAALGGVLAAFLALPAAGVIQAAVQEYGGRRYAVVESELTSDVAVKDDTDEQGLAERLRDRLPWNADDDDS
jgi:predicted PurR-regulated permease PerM